MKRLVPVLLAAVLSACAYAPDKNTQEARHEAPGSNAPPPGETPSATASLVREGRTLLAAGNTTQAAAAVERALRIEPANPYLWLELGRVRLAEGDRRQALALGQKAQRLAGNDPAAREAAQDLISRATSQ